MKKLAILLMFIVVAGIQFQAEAQFIKRLKRAAQHKVEDKVIETTEKGIDKAFDKGEQEMWEAMEKERTQAEDSEYTEDDSDDEAMSGAMPGLQKKYMKMMGGGAPIEIADTYTFTKKIRYHISSNSEGKQGSMDYTLWLNPDEGYTGGELSNFKDESKKSENEDVSILTIMDNKHEAMIMLMQEQKMATVISTATPEGMEGEMVQVEEVEDDTFDDENVRFEKTGRTKKILGYNCEEYVINTSDSKSNIWITKEMDDYNDALLKSMKDDSPFILTEGFADLEGMMMEMNAESIDDKTGEEVTMTMKVVEISDRPVKFDMSDYQKMNIGGPPPDKR